MALWKPGQWHRPTHHQRWTGALTSLAHRTKRFDERLFSCPQDKTHTHIWVHVQSESFGETHASISGARLSPFDETCKPEMRCARTARRILAGSRRRTKKKKMCAFLPPIQNILEHKPPPTFLSSPFFGACKCLEYHTYG